MTVQIPGVSRGLDRIRLTAITQRGRFGNGAPPAFFWRLVSLGKPINFSFACLILQLGHLA